MALNELGGSCEVVGAQIHQVECADRHRVHLLDLVRQPAVAVGRIFSDTFAGITPASVAGFVLAELVGAALGAGLVLALYPDVARGRGCGRPARRPPLTRPARLTRRIDSASIESMSTDWDVEVVARAAVHAALGDPGRLAIVDALAFEDVSPSWLQASLGMVSNLLAHHVGVLEGVGVVRRLRSEGDRRRAPT